MMDSLYGFRIRLQIHSVFHRGDKKLPSRAPIDEQSRCYRMKVFGITGGIGMGKTAITALIEEKGVAVVDTDQLARKVVEPGQPALLEVQSLFGTGVISTDGRLLRQELARRVFGSAVSRKQLEAILHPRIRALWMQQLEDWRAEGKTSGAIVIPLLYETHAEKHFDFVMCVACSPEVQRARLIARKMVPDQIEQRIKSQWAIEKKMELADYVIWNEGELADSTAQIDAALKDAGVLS
ncbi:MAG: dephospho-CoA kinase [Limisphaerales bacterium]|jgi:dephospho-CoA kinase